MGISVQVWGLDDKLQASFGPLGQSRFAFDPLNKRTTQAGFRETSLDTVASARAYLLSVLVVVWIYGVIIAGIASWFTLGQALEPLKSIVETAENINRADDLSRRIPQLGSEEDEIGSLIGTFNKTLERLEALFTSQQRFLADVSHELRTPLTVVKGNVDLMRRMKQFDAESLTSIDQEAGRLTRLVGGLLLLAQAESGKLPLNFQPVELDLLITEVFQEMRVIAGDKVHVHLNEIDQMLVNGDRDRLKQVLINSRECNSIHTAEWGCVS